jgi:periplasmic protein TonB
MSLVSFTFGQKKDKDKNNADKTPTVVDDASKIKVVEKDNEIYYTINGHLSISADPDVAVDEGGKIEDNVLYNASTIEAKPDFPGVLQKFYVFVQKNLVIPETLKAEKFKGMVIASFVVEKDVKITDVKMVRGSGTDIGQEVVRVLKMMPNWMPGQNNGKM